MSHRVTVVFYIPFLVLFSACESESGSGVGNATNGSLAGVWDGPIAEDDRMSDRTRNVLQFDPAAAAGEPRRYAIIGETVSGPLLGSRPTLAVMQTGAWRVEDGHVGWDADDGSQTANEIFGFTGKTLTLESASTLSGRLKYSRVTGCPDPQEPEGWSLTTRQLMSHGSGLSSPGGTSLTVDSHDRVHVVSGGGELVYFTRGDGCLWQSYGLGQGPARAVVFTGPATHLWPRCRRPR